MPDCVLDINFAWERGRADAYKFSGHKSYYLGSFRVVWQSKSGPLELTDLPFRDFVAVGRRV